MDMATLIKEGKQYNSIERLGTVFVRKLDAEGKPAGVERMVEPGYYISGCEYAELTI